MQEIPDEYPRGHWLRETDWLRFLVACALLTLALLCLICVVIAVFMFVTGKLTAALFWMLFAVVVKPWR